MQFFISALGWHRAIAVAAIFLFLPPEGLAQAADEQFDFDVAAQPLTDALVEFSLITGRQVSTNSALVRNRRSSATKGRLSPDDALISLLEGTGLAARVVNGRNYSLRAAEVESPPPRVALPPIDEIIVTGELLDRRLEETLTSVVVVSGETLERRGEADIFDLIERTPGVGISAGESGFTVRGITQFGPGGAGNGLTVSTTVDGANVSNSRATSLGPYSVWDLEQVEVLRGPQSTQSGRNALAGAIVVRSKDPDYYTERRIRVEAGENGLYGAAFALNTPLIEDKLALRISGQLLDNDGEIRNETLGTDANRRRDETLRVSLRADPTDDLGVVFKHSVSDVNTGENLVDTRRGTFERVSTANFQTNRENRTESTNFRVNYAVSPILQLQWESTYYETETEGLIDIDGTDADLGTRDEDRDIQSIQHEARLVFDTDRLKGVVGAFYTDVDLGSNSEFLTSVAFVENFLGISLGVSGAASSILRSTGNTENYALFGELAYQLTDKLEVTLGARYDREEFGFSDTITENTYESPAVEAIVGPLLGPAGVTVTPSQGTFDFSAFLPKFALGYDITDDMRLGFTAQQGYRAGGSATSPILGIPYDYDAEFAWNYELALRAGFLENRVSVNANVFYMDWTDQQILQATEVTIGTPASPGVATDFLVLNAGESQLFGGELAINARPTESTDLFLSLAYVDTEFSDFVTSSQDFTGNEFPEAPNLTAAIGATRYFSNGWYVGADASYQAESFTGAGNFDLFQSRTLYNARIGYEAEDWSVFAYGRNLSDKDYQIGGAILTAENVASVGEGRVIGIVAQYNF